jgi:hypothetical protein
MEHQRALAQALEIHKDDILTLAGDLNRIPSENPPGNHYRAWSAFDRNWIAWASRTGS